MKIEEKDTFRARISIDLYRRRQGAMQVTAKTRERIATPHLFWRRPPRARSRRRHQPTTSAWVWLLCLASGLAGTAIAQRQDLTSPSTTTVALDGAQSTVLSLPAPATFPLYISLSLCAIPASLAANESFTLPVELARALYVSNSSSNPSPGPSADPGATGVPRGAEGDSSVLAYGYANVTIGAAAEGNITISVYAPDAHDLLRGGDGRWTDDTVPDTPADRNEQWTFELSISNGTELSPYLATGQVGLRLEDTDATSVLLAATNQSGSYTPVLASTSDLAFPLARSHCFVRRAMTNNVATPSRVAESLTSRGYGPGDRNQFLISDLARGTNFTAWLVENGTSSGDGSSQMRVYDPVFFATKNSELSPASLSLSSRLIAELPPQPTPVASSSTCRLVPPSPMQSRLRDLSAPRNC